MLPGITALIVMLARRELDRGGAEEAELRGLGRAVVRPAGEAGDRPGDRGGDDHAAVAAAPRARGSAAFTDSIVPLTLVAKIASMSCLGHVGELDVGEDAGVGAQDVEAAEPLDRLGHHALAVGRRLATSAIT